MVATTRPSWLSALATRGSTAHISIPFLSF